MPRLRPILGLDIFAPLELAMCPDFFFSLFSYGIIDAH